VSDAAHPARLRRFDAVVGVLLLAGSVGYLAALPRKLGESDEGLFLYEATRILAGDVFYRDVYDIIPPGAHYLMAAIFWLFGSNITTAAIATAVVHGSIVALTYLVARRLGVRPALAVLAGAVHLALCQSAFPHATPHWFSTALTVLLLYVFVAAPGSAMLPGVLCGAMVMIQHHHGIVTALGAGVVIVADHVLVPPTAGGPGLVRRVVRFAGGLALVLVPAFGALAARVGPETLVHALVLQPLENYVIPHQTFDRLRWGFVTLQTGQQAKHTVPAVLRWLPIVLPVDIARAGAALARGDRSRLRTLVLLLVSSLAAMASVANYPDFIHAGFVGAILAVTAVELIESGLRTLPARLGAPLGAAVAAGALLLAAVQLRHHLRLSLAEAPVRHPTAFGEVAFGSAERARVVDDVRALLGAAGTDELFVYPVFPALYLLAGARNPTRYQLLIPVYSPTYQIEESLAVLERRQLPYVAVIIYGLKQDDPVLAYLNARYHPVIVALRAGVVVFGRGPGP
jgi:hypothetical protein